MRRSFWLPVVLALTFGVGAEPAAAAVDCGQEVTADAPSVRSGYRLNRRLNQFVQTLTVTNASGTPIQGPIAAALTNLSANATLFNSAGALPCAGATGAPYIEIAAGPDNVLSPGEKTSIVLHFQNANSSAITYGLRLYASSLPVNPVQDVTITPDVIFVGPATQVTIRALVPYTGPAPTVELLRVDASGNVLGVEGTLVDNGSLAAGDEIQGDGLFSMRKAFQGAQPETIHFKIHVVNPNALSSAFLLRIVNALTDQQLNDIVSTQQTLQQLYQNTPGTPAQKLAAVLAALGQDPDVIQYGQSDSGNGVWILHQPGILGGLLLNPDGTRGSVPVVPAGHQVPPAAIEPTPVASTASIASTPVSVASARLPFLESASALADPNEVGNTKVLIGSPFLFQFGATDEGAGLRTLYQNSTCPKYDVTYLTNAAFTVDVVKTMGNYGVIHLATHGDTYYNGLLSFWTDQFGWSVPGSQVVFLTGQTATAANKATYNADLAAGRLAIVSGYYGILPSFITAYGGSFPNSLVFIGACRSTFNTTMQDAFLGRGAATYLGFSEYVNSGFAFGRANYFHNAFVNDPNNLVTTGDIFIPGQSDASTPPAFWQMGGSNTLQLPSGNELQNGGFETGTLGAWSGAGDGRVVPQLGAFFFPTEGNFAGIISTGLGFTTSAGSVSQKVCLPADSKTLSFDWNYTSEEFREWCGSQFQDTFRVQITTDTGTTTLFSRTVDQLCSGTFQVPFSFDRPPGSNWSFGWQTTNVDVSALATANSGKSVTITFAVTDVGDSIFDTAVLIDKIAIKK
jgi:hypothetical protein